MTVMTEATPFKEFLFNKFLEWEKTQPKKRSSITAYARWLTDNSYEVEVKQQVVDSWMNGSIPKDHKFILVLAEKIGDEIYDVLILPRPNPYLKVASANWEFVSEETQKRIAREIAEEAAKYEAQAKSKGSQKAPKPRKTDSH